MSEKAIDRLKKAMDEVCYGDPDAAADMIRDVLEAYAEHVEETEPYATKCIAAARAMAGSMHHASEALEGITT